MKALEVGDECLVTKYVASFDEYGVWTNFHAVVIKVNEHSAVLDVSDSPELTRKQKRATITGRINVSKRHIDGRFIGHRPNTVVNAYGGMQAKGRGSNGRSWTVATAKEDREALAKRVLGLYKKGFTRSQAGKLLNRRPETIARAERETGIVPPQRMAARVMKLDGEVKYYTRRAQAAQEYGLPAKKLHDRGTHEVPGAILEAGSWVIFDGEVHEYREGRK
ncbi:hypothetical protein [Lacticaseibacillus absianus]|uniref:hypothetical protein n=1 Tax=Lacticaseibacillus absianus TaxID=2729623 RepID=UPI0015CB2D7D|nr:hypothetical protein [Lacticaseibacillus absianus]